MSQEISFIVAFAAVFGSAEAIRQTQAKTRRQEHRSRKNNLLVHCVKSSSHSAEIEGRHVILSGEKVCTILSYHAFFIDLPSSLSMFCGCRHSPSPDETLALFVQAIGDTGLKLT